PHRHARSPPCSSHDRKRGRRCSSSAPQCIGALRGKSTIDRFCEAKMSDRPLAPDAAAAAPETAAAPVRRRVLSGMRPTGAMHLGHWHGALKNWVRLQDEYECFFFAADWHALTTHYEEREVI